MSKFQNYIHIFIYTVDEKYQANQRGCHLSEKNPEDSKCFALNFINLNDKKIYNNLPHMSCCLIQTFHLSGFFSVFTKPKPVQRYFWFCKYTEEEVKGETSVFNTKTCEEVWRRYLCCRSFCHSSLHIYIYITADSTVLAFWASSVQL